MGRIAEVDFLIGDAERAVSHQMTEIERLRAEGHDTAKAEELLQASGSAAGGQAEDLEIPPSDLARTVGPTEWTENSSSCGAIRAATPWPTPPCRRKGPPCKP
jgi:hypothetical protein